jgi:hypothetical protein
MQLVNMNIHSNFLNVYHSLFILIDITPKRLLNSTRNKPDLGNVPLFRFIFRLFETFCRYLPWNKLRKNTNFMIFESMDQKLWVFENFRRSLGRLACVGANQQELIISAQKSGQQE